VIAGWYSDFATLLRHVIGLLNDLIQKWSILKEMQTFQKLVSASLKEFL